ncbi:hypothetical protein BGLA2_140022 [Burkholderia gladioli]|nr:hypothetical protein BGLA2_140022 [Burkholderia gladioli]
MHRRIGPPTAARPAPGGPERPTHKCIKTVHFYGQVGRGHNCARGGGRAILCGRGAARECPSGASDGPPRPRYWDAKGGRLVTGEDRWRWVANRRLLGGHVWLNFKTFRSFASCCVGSLAYDCPQYRVMLLGFLKKKC